MNDLAGKRFGRLTAIEPTEKRLNGSIVWRCECDCGNECEVPSSSLVTGNTRSCGCLKGGAGEARSVGRDLAGERFGKLVAVRPVGRKNGGVVWECQCDCGNVKNVVGHHLTSGKTKSCGCLRTEREKPAGRSYDLTGQAFGDLTAVERVGTKSRYALWKCSCACGGTCEATSHDLRSGKALNCGGPSHVPGDVVVVPGRRFGKLTAVNKTDLLRSGSPVWRCICDCDRTRECSERDLLTGRITSCGRCD